MLDKCPNWLIKWTVKVLEYMRYEEESLPVELVDLTDRMGRKLYESMEMVKVAINHLLIITSLKQGVFSIQDSRTLLLHLIRLNTFFIDSLIICEMHFQ